MPPMAIVTILVTLIQLWWSIAHLYAYIQLRHPLLLVQVTQGAAFGLLFFTITISIMGQQQHVSGMLSGVLLLLGLVMGIVWRRGNGVNMFINHYPRAIIDVLLFRKPL